MYPLKATHTLFIAFQFDTENESYSSFNTSGLNSSVAAAEANSWTQAVNGSIIYFYDDTPSTHTISTIDVVSGVQSVFAEVVVNQADAQGICLDSSTDTVFIAGNGAIESCTESSGCSSVSQTNLNDVNDAACEYMDGSVYVFGGGNEGALVDSVYQCNATSADSCTLISLAVFPIFDSVQTIWECDMTKSLCFFVSL